MQKKKKKHVQDIKIENWKCAHTYAYQALYR
jgi:hypothetical protein